MFDFSAQPDYLSAHPNIKYNLLDIAPNTALSKREEVMPLMLWYSPVLGQLKTKCHVVFFSYLLF